MKNFKQLFHLLSYLQYPLLLVAVVLTISPFFKGIKFLASNIDYFFKIQNIVLIFLGVALSFSTLQDSDKTSLKVEKKIYRSPKKAKFLIISTLVLIFIFFIYGFIAYFFLKEYTALKEFSYGSIVLGIGLIGYLKLQLEMFEKNRKDKNEQ